MRRVRFAFGTLLGVALLSSGCAATDENEEAKSPDSVASDAPQQSPMEELQAIPKDLRAEVAKLTKPIDDVDAVIDQITSIPKRHDVNAAALASMVKAALQGGAVKLKVKSNVSDEAKAEITGALTKLKGAVTALKQTPERVALLGKKIATQVSRIPTLAGKVGASAATTIANPFADAAAKAKAQADMDNVKQVAADVVKVVTDTQAKILALPSKATGALSKLTAALAGDGSAPASDDGDDSTAPPAVAGGGGGRSKRKAILRIPSTLAADSPNLRPNIEAVLVQRGFAPIAEASVDEALKGARGTEPQRLEEVRAALEADAVVSLARGTSLGAGRKTIAVSVSTARGGAKAAPRAITGRAEELDSKVPAAIAELLGQPDGGVGSSTSPGKSPPTSSAPAPAAELAPAPTPVATASGAAAPSSSVDQVVLKDGGIVRGRVLKHEPGTFVTIETPEGAQRTIAWDRVSEVIVGPPKKSR